MSTTTAEAPKWHDARQEGTHHLTTAEALQWISNAPRATKFMLHVSMDAPVAGTGEGEGCKVFNNGCGGGVQLSGHAVMDFIRSGLSKTLEDKGGRWRCTVRTYKVLDKKHVTYWIG